MTDTVTEHQDHFKKTWAELAEEEEEYLEEFYIQQQNKQEEQAGKCLTNFQTRMIERLKRHNGKIEVGLQQVPLEIKIRNIEQAFRKYQIFSCHFQRNNCFFYLPLEQAIKLVEETNLRITILSHTLHIVMLPIKK